MKGIAFILALIIFSTSLKASAFTQGMISTMNGEISSFSCCQKTDTTETKECSDSSSEDQEEEGCCEGPNCHCTCCLHIAYLQQFSFTSFSSNDFSGVNFGFSFLYKDDYLKSVFHPPSFL